MKMPRITPSFVLATLALLVAAATGVATAAPLIKGGDIARNAITTKHVKNGSLQSTDLSAKARKDLRGLTGYQVVSGASATSEAENDWLYVTVKCPKGKKALGHSVQWHYTGDDPYGPAVFYHSTSTATLLPEGDGYDFRGSPLYAEFQMRAKVTCAKVG